jgi:hypothetical protein
MAERGRLKRTANQNKLMSNVLNSKTVSSLGSSNNGLKRGLAGAMGSTAALALMKAPNNKQRLQQSDSALRATMRKEIDLLDEANNPKALADAVKAKAGRTGDIRAKAKAATMKEAPNLLRYADTAAGRQVMLEKLRDLKYLTDEDMSQFLETDQNRSQFRSGTGNLQGEYVSIRNAMQGERKAMAGLVLRMNRADSNYQVMDPSGNKIGAPINRNIGDVDITTVGSAYSKMTANEFSQKHVVDNFVVLQRAGMAGATSYQKQAAQDVAQGMAMGADANILKQAFDATNRNAINANTRVQAIEGFRATYDHAWKEPQHHAKLEAAMSKLGQDEAVTMQLAIKAGMDKSAAESLSGSARAIVVREWIRGQNYVAGSSRDYESEAAAGHTGWL